MRKVCSSFSLVWPDVVNSFRQSPETPLAYKLPKKPKILGQKERPPPHRLNFDCAESCLLWRREYWQDQHRKVPLPQKNRQAKKYTCGRKKSFSCPISFFPGPTDRRQCEKESFVDIFPSSSHKHPIFPLNQTFIFWGQSLNIRGNVNVNLRSLVFQLLQNYYVARFPKKCLLFF